jgi:hypothetical protein
MTDENENKAHGVGIQGLNRQGPWLSLLSPSPLLRFPSRSLPPRLWTFTGPKLPFASVSISSIHPILIAMLLLLLAAGR